MQGDGLRCAHDGGDESAVASFVDFNGDTGGVGKCRRFGDAHGYLARFGKGGQQPVGHVVREGFEQVHMAARALTDNRFVQGPIVQDAVDVSIVDWLIHIDLDFCIDVNGLCGDAFVLKDADAGIKRDARKNDSSCRHVVSCAVAKSRL